MMVLPAIRIDNFLVKKRTKREADVSEKPEVEFECIVPRHGVHAFAVLNDGEMIVKAGSKVRPEWVGDRTHKTYYWKLHDSLVAAGTISNGVLREDYAFASPSAAAAVVSGRSSNGRTAWQLVGTDKTYADWEASQLSEVTA